MDDKKKTPKPDILCNIGIGAGVILIIVKVTQLILNLIN
jgi:hypothetical protein